MAKQRGGQHGSSDWNLNLTASVSEFDTSVRVIGEQKSGKVGDDPSMVAEVPLDSAGKTWPNFA